jgi:hypothetical protein
MSGRVLSGMVVGNPGKCGRTGFTGGDQGKGLGGGVGNVYSDTGGASRFFKVVKLDE